MKLALIVYEDDAIKQIGSCKVYKAKISNTNLGPRTMTWNNTNKLLGKSGFYGLKTGITCNAGGCLVTYYKNVKNQNFVCVVLGSHGQEKRFSETQILI